VKLDGWRGQLHKCGGEVRLYSKRGNDIGYRFPDVVRAAAVLPVGNVILDGEITALDGEGLPNFEALQWADRDYLPVFWAFDLMIEGRRWAGRRCRSLAAGPTTPVELFVEVVLQPKERH